jgi:pimeloyl-ACP methyl ester carboxylesterase
VWLRIALAVAVGAGLIWLGVRPQPWRPLTGKPNFASCIYPGDLSAWCADLPLRGTRLHVTVIPATDRSEGALFYLEGGPGIPSTASAVQANALFARVGRRRDLVMVDQRGTRGPRCPAGHVPARDAAAVTAYLGRCFARLHVDARLDTTTVAADDIDAVRRALGYARIDVFGTSYGATVAQMYAQRHPASLRTMTLDSGSLPGVRIYEASARNAEHALAAVLARCRCPKVRGELSELLARPPRRVLIETGTVRLGPAEIAWTVNAMSESAEGASRIPTVVTHAAHGDYLSLARAYAERVGPDLDPRSRLPMVWAVLCSEPWAQFGTAGDNSYLSAAVAARARVFQRACHVVPKVHGASERARPTHVPVLLLAGGADPLDPPANLRGWHTLYPDGRLVVVPGASHGVMQYPCVQALAASFVERGTTHGLHAACARHVALPPFETG